MADVAMEIEGKASGGRAAAAHLDGCCVFCVVCSVVCVEKNQMAGKKLCFFFDVQICLNPWTVLHLTDQTSNGTFLGVGKVCFYVLMFEKLCL
jgi:hypothetical protein